MDIAALSMSLAQTNLMSQISTAVMGKALDVMKGDGAETARLLESVDTAPAQAPVPAQPYLGAKLDVYA
ncbi:MAG: YjfB family protein [Clostridia bacterium]|nr:YjfB family protein [Clostridia bacterium]